MKPTDADNVAYLFLMKRWPSLAVAHNAHAICDAVAEAIRNERERAAKVARNNTDHVAGKIIADKIMAGA